MFIQGDRSLWRAWYLAAIVVAVSSASTPAQDAPSEVDAEISRQQAVADRFLTVLEKNPRRGTALDRVYGFHVENGTVENFVERFRKRVETDPKDGAAWMVLGLIEAQRGKDAEAVAAFTQAVEVRDNDALAAYYLGQSLLLTGQPEKAAAALEKAITRKPAQTDLLEIFQTLGRIHQRAQRHEEALAVGTRLERLFPNDARVQEQIAVTLVEEGQLSLALPRYEALIKITKDEYRKSVYTIEAAELKVKLSRSAEAVSDLETLLATLNPTSWLHREVRRKIEEVYLRTDDQDGLAKYYEGWIGKHPEDVDAMARLARVLARQARVPEAQSWLDKALKLAPSRKELRRAFIEQLVDDQRFADAAVQYALLDKTEPNNPDTLREWGKLILRDTARTKEVRRSEAEKVWRRLLAARPNDPLITTQVADLFRHCEMHEPALELYQKAVSLAPEQPQYREYLGEFYHQLNRPEEAVATWRQLAAGKLRTASNVARLAEVLASYGYLEQAVPEIQAACKLDPKDFSLQIKAAELLSKAQKYTDADAALTAANRLVQNDDEAELVLAAQISLYQTDGSLGKRTSELATAAAMPDATAQQSYVLARYYEAQRQYAEATTAIVEALKAAPRSVPMLAAAARIRQQAGDLKAAADTYRQLALTDRRGRSEYLKQVAQLEAQLGRVDDALATGKELVASAPGNTENYEFYADLCFRLGKSEEGLNTLRRAVRVNPNETALALKLAASLAEMFRTDEAIELYWQAFDKEAGLDGKLGIIPNLVELYLQTNHLDRLMERLERQRRDADDKREMTISLAQAYHSAGDYGMARQELESLISESTRDTQLLQQLAKLAESEGDLTDAVKYQERLAKLAPGPETEYRLATLLSQSGAHQESAAILVRLALREEDFEKVLRNIDSLLVNDQAATALQVIQSKLREEPQNWELLYREGVALSTTPAEARARFEAILALSVADDALGIAAKNAAAKAAKSKNPAIASQALARRMNRFESAYQVRIAAGLASPDYYGVARPAFWAPRDFSQARLASIAWLIRLAQDEGTEQLKSLTDRFRRPGEAANASATALWDWASFLTVQSDTSENRGRVREVVRRLAQQNDNSAQQLFLAYLRPDVVAVNAQGGAAKLPPLPDEELDLALECYKALQKNANAYVMNNATIVMKELERAGRKKQADELYQEFISDARDAEQITRALMLNVQREQTQAALELFRRWSELTLKETRPASNYSASMPNFLCELIGLSRAAKDDAAVLNVLDAYLDHNRERAKRQRPRPAARTSMNLVRSNYYVLYIGNRRQSVNFAYPQPNDYFDAGAIQLLRNAYESFRQRDLVSDLEQHVARRLANATAADKVYEHLALGYLQWWNENTEGAVEQLTAASSLVPHDIQLQLEIAEFQTQLENFDAALDIVDAVAPTTQDLLRKKETLALNLAVRLGDHDRAKKSAERLFGLRLDVDTQVQLATQLRRLGMAEEAEAVLMRAQRQSGSRLAGQVALMSSYQSSGKTEIAAQIASQILRRSRSAAPNGNRRYSTSDDSARVSALQVLNAAGKLKSMIAETEQQLSRSPEATQLYHSVIEYYQASGNNQKALEWQGKLVELRGDDPTMRVAYARQLAATGKLDEACSQYSMVIKARPRLIQGELELVFNTYRQANEVDELMDLLGTIDLRQFGQYYQVTQIVQTLLRDTKQRPLGIVMLKRAWEAFPEQRVYLVSSMYDDELWDVKEIYEFGKQSLIPDAATIERDPWHGIGQVRSYSGDGVVNTSFRSILRTAAKNNQLPALREEILVAAKQHPDWIAGPLLAAIIDANLGNNVGVLRQKVEHALAAEPPMPFAARWIIGLELEQHKSLNDLIVKLYEGALEGRDGSSISMQFQYSPAPRLVKLYLAAGRKDAARVLLAKAEEEKYSDYDPAYAESQQIGNWINLASQYEQLEFPLDALRLYRKSLTHLATSTDNPYGNSEYYSSLAQRQLDALTQKLLANDNASAIPQLLRVGDDKDNPSSLDLMWGLKSNSAGIPQFNSQLFDLLTAAKESPQTRLKTSKAIEELAASHGDDLNVAILSAAWALEVKDAANIPPRVRHLVALVEMHPLEELPAGQRPNSRQRAEALRHVGLWLAARACLTTAEFREEGQWLADKALEGARRQINSNHAVALLVEAAQRSIANEDKEAAAKDLGLLIDIALTRPKSKGPATHAPPVTSTQFRHGLLAARLAADLGLADLSLRAARESLRGGLPVPDTKQTIRRGAISSTLVIVPSQDRDEQLLDTFGNELRNLSKVWRAKQLPAAEMYDLLHDIVFPVNRPDEILLYEQAISDWSRPQSVGLELMRWSSDAKRQAKLLKAIQERGEKPAARVPALVLKVFSAVETKDQASAQAALLELQKPDQAAQARAALTLHAAALAFQIPAFKADALPLLVATFKTPGQLGNSAGAVELVGKYFAQNRQTDDLRELYNEYLLSRQRMYVQQDADYANYVLSNDLNQIVQTIGMAGDVRLTLEYLARTQDLPESRYGNRISNEVPLYHLAWQLTALKPEERYQLLRDWTMPDKSRRTLRFIAAYSTGNQIPVPFLPPHLAALGPSPAIGLMDNFTMLVAAAHEAGKLSELQEAVDKSVTDDLPHARLLAALVAIARDDAQAPVAIEKLIADSRARMKSPTPSGQSVVRNLNMERLSDIVLMNAALDYRPTRPAGQKFADAVLQDNRQGFHLERLAQVSRTIALDALRDLPAAVQQSLHSPGLKLWLPGTPPEYTSGSQPPVWWAANENYISHIAGFEYDSLFFKYPLEGNFEFSFEAHGYDFSQGEVAYGGLISVPEYWNQSVDIMPVSRHETLKRNAAVEARDWWNRYSVQVSPQAIRFFSNGHLVYEEADPSPTSPWLHLVSLDHRRTAFRNLRLAGEPRIPRSVPLSHGNRLEGWRSLLGDTLPKRLTANVTTVSSTNEFLGNELPMQSKAKPHWTSQDGIIHGRYDADAMNNAQACLSYHRPLQPGESVTYEFLYEPGKTHVHPALGRLTFLLETEGIRTHWQTMPVGPANPIDLEPQNAIDEVESRRGPAKLPLKPGKWNKLQISLVDDVAEIKLNGQAVMERRLEANNPRRLGLFHYRDQTAAQVRNIVLTGDWPEQLDDRDRQNLTALVAADESREVRRARHALVREEEQADEAIEVWKRAQNLPLQDRYDYLKSWVLPTSSHPTIRLHAHFTPADQPAPAISAALSPLKGARLHVGGQAVSPAWELVRVATSLKRLSELRSALDEATDVPDAERSRLAFEVLLAVAEQDDAAAKAALAKVLDRLQALPGDTLPYGRFPEFTAVMAALERPALYASALPVAELLVENQHSNYQTLDWERLVRWLRAKARWHVDEATTKLAFGETSQKIPQWQAVSHPTAEQRGRGLPPATWHVTSGKASFHTGQGGDSLYFQSPLAGDFEVRCKRTTFGWKEIRVQYASVAIDVHNDGQSIWRNLLARGQTQHSLDAKIPKWGEQVDCRIQVKDRTYTVFINDKEIHREVLGPHADPWLTIQTNAPHFNGQIEDFQILGQPTVPDVLHLSEADDLYSWRADYYGESVDTDDAQWQKKNGEIVGHLFANALGSQRESVLQYHRPLLEDGKLSYEFYYEPGKYEVHPALDRAALLISPSGVRVHYLTDGAYNRTDVAPDNVTPLAAASDKPPLKIEDWNTLEMQLTGDVVTLTLNNQQIAKYPVEVTNQRIFGLFRYSDATSARVRNVTYRGEWPKTLPSLHQQILRKE